jgi:hypothetical protein
MATIIRIDGPAGSYATARRETCIEMGDVFDVHVEYGGGAYGQFNAASANDAERIARVAAEVLNEWAGKGHPDMGGVIAFRLAR